MPGKTLQLNKPFGATFALALSVLLLMTGGLEFAVRQERVQRLLDFPSLNSRHRHFELQWQRLERLAKSGAPVDCIALGNSMVLNGFDPWTFSSSFQEKTGETIHCFNFGVDALTPVAAQALAQILVDTYHPRLLIFGTDARDFAIPPDSEETTVITASTWVQYRLGTFSLSGWLADHSYAYRYRYRLAELLLLSRRSRSETNDTRYGFEPLEQVGDVDDPPDRADGSYHVQYYFRTLSNYRIPPENPAALAEILQLPAHLVVVEMPVPDSYFAFFDEPELDYAEFQQTLRAVTAEHSVSLLDANQARLIPADGWADYSHVTSKGAPLFSHWLGQHIGTMVASSLATDRSHSWALREIR